MLFSGEVSTLDVILIFTNKGNYIYLPVYKIPVFKWKELGTHINNLVQMTEQEAIVKIMKISSFKEQRNLLFVTRNNLVKQTELKEFEVSRYTKPVRAISLSKNDEVVSVDITDNTNSELVIFSDKGQALRFNLTEIPVTSTTAKGVKGMNLNPKQHLSAGIILKDYNDLLLLTNRGTIKRINVLDIPKKKRTNKGVQLYKVVQSNPYLVQDLCLLNATQYKQRAKITVNTDTTSLELSAFDIKHDKTENGKAFVKKSLGNSVFINIENLEEDLSITPLSEYVREDDQELVQGKLFE
jgi:topoisomerase-4 subunit A